MTIRLHLLITTSIAFCLLHSPPLAAQTVATAHDAHRLHGDPTAYMASLDDPKRDAWQKPHDVLVALDLKPGQVVADIGAGSGYFALRFARHVGATGKVLAVDVAGAMLDEVARRAATASLGNVTPVLARPDDPTLPAGGVDVVFTCNTWHHIDERPSYLAKVKQALAPGGRFVIVDFHKDAPVGPPASMKLARADVLAEVQRAGFALANEPTFLPHQYFLVFTAK
jgi:ubiquinone/menaquinone biosynthesis C-methylase UbiE